jgi:DUF4097 and DUF4098 domain-containing protein YvlB
MLRLSVFLAALLVVSCSLLGIVDYQKSRVEREETKTWDASEVSRVEVENVNGNLSVSAGSGDEVSAKITRFCTGKDQADAEAHIDEVVVSAEVVGGVLTVQVEFPEDDPRTFGADIEVTAPTTTPVDLKSTNGNIDVTSTNAEMKLETTNGNITTHGVRGNITAKGTNGQLDIDMSELAVAHRVSLSATNGSTELTIPDNSSAMFTLATTNGEVSVTGFGNVTYTVNTKKNKVGVIGTGAGLITATSTNGDIELKAK